MIELSGWVEVPQHILNWWSSGSEHWNAVAWHHVQTGTYATFDWRGNQQPKSFSINGTSFSIDYVHPVDPSIVLVLDAWIRFFDVWEPNDT